MTRPPGGRARRLAGLAAGLLGMTAVGLGLAWLVLDRPLLPGGFPSNRADAIAGILAGLAAIVLSVLRLRRRAGPQARQAWRPDA